MGSGTKPKASAQPKTVFPSGGTGAGASGGVGATISGGSSAARELELNLIHLNLDLLEKTAEGEGIQIELEASPLQVMTKNGRLGDVPERYEARIKQNNLLSGSVIRIRVSPASVRVALRN